jgi:hypothetical protein
MSSPSADDVRKANMVTVASAHAVYIEAVRRVSGEKGLKAVAEANRLHGLELGKAGLAAGGLRKDDLRSIYEFFQAAHPYFGFEIELLKATNHELEMKVTYCPWIDTFKSSGANSDICGWICKTDEGIGQAVDPKLKMAIPKCMMRGDSYCVYRYQK